LVDGLLAPFGLRTISERNKRILEITKNLEEALVKADEILSAGDKNEIKKVDRQLRSYLPTLEG